jgi:hypothetical protein
MHYNYTVLYTIRKSGEFSRNFRILRSTVVPSQTHCKKGHNVRYFPYDLPRLRGSGFSVPLFKTHIAFLSLLFSSP